MASSRTTLGSSTRVNAAISTSPIKSSHVSSTVPSFWDIANSKLDLKTRKSLVHVNIGTGRVIDAVLQEAVAKQKSVSAKRWKLVVRGKEVILRDVFAKIIKWIDHFKAVGDIAVQFNSGAASLPWAAVRFLLQIATNEKQYLEATIEGIEMATEMIATYATVETLYLDPEFQVHTQIRTKVVGLYGHILSFLGESIQYYQQSIANSKARQ
ncbi:hypothetical protein FB567DRAFT_331514 [Paraphoma chrysanthemicola]|uniref:NWD NACHT-NTPase N-terminal domain-containing protein n=1 Tax=Paraphoma chrysanthemicola TaxID=798071 RepID=A0A8K0R9S1_9PLEO|nr:hypothetical protein FB567DRAFT_331514 [Paraphoma chrysanthemicola]